MIKKRPFNCDTFDTNFGRKDYLNKHMTAVHEGKKPFKCDICDAKFAQKPHLIRHITAVHD